MTFVALLSFSVMLAGGFFQATRAADDATRANERQLVSNHLGIVVHAMLATEAVQLTWDEAVRSVGGQAGSPDLKWADTNLGQFLAHVAKTDAIYLVTPRGDLLRGWQGDRQADASYAPLAPAVRRIIANLSLNRSLNEPAREFRRLQDGTWPYAAAGRPLTRWAGGFIWYEGRPALITVISIIPDVNYGLLRRTPNHVVSLRFVDAGMLEEIGGAVLLGDVRFTPMQPDASSDRNSSELRGIDGRPLGWLSWRPHAVGSQVLRRTAPLLGAYLLFFVGVLVVGTLMIRQALRVAREMAAREAQAQHHALHDPMLGLPNRAHVMQRLRALLQEDPGTPARPGEGEQEVLLAYFDLDHFKAINESIGHHVGDDLLAQIVARVRERFGPNYVLGRLASDEFVLLRPGESGREAADRLGEELMAIFADPFIVFGHSVPVSASCGISWAPDHGRDAKGLLRNADIALFHA
ncbi:MAG TPA: diguanylate cyclase, partial [Novosphingobium sp.]